DHRPHRTRHPRPDAGTAMIRPTGRAVLIFVAGIPLALFVAIYNPSLWALWFNYGLLLLVVAACDAWLAFPPRLLGAKVTVPDHLYIGEHGATIVTIAAARWRRATTFELISEQRGEIEPSDIVTGVLPVGEAARIALPINPRRRGQVHVDWVW